MKKEIITKKDLIYWLIILTIIIIGICTQFYGDDNDVLSHISFAGTLSSIVLAVVAIIFSFYQSYSSQSSTDRLVEVVAKIDNSMTNLSLLETNLSKIENTLDETNEKLVETSGSINDEVLNVINSVNDGINKSHVNQADIKNDIKQMLGNINNISSIESSPPNIQFILEYISSNEVQRDLLSKIIVLSESNKEFDLFCVAAEVENESDIEYDFTTGMKVGNLSNMIVLLQANNLMKFINVDKIGLLRIEDVDKITVDKIKNKIKEYNGRGSK